MFGPLRPFARHATTLVVVALLAPATPAALQAQSGEEIMRTALERYEERMQGVENYTVVQEVMGFESSTYFEKQEIEGHTVFVPQEQMGSEAAQQAPDSPYSSMFELAERSTHEGTETVDGERCHVVSVTDFEGVDLWSPPEGAGDGEFTPRKAVFHVDTDDYLIRKMKVDGTTTVQGESRDVSFTAHMRDYREVEGVVHPFLMEISVEGFQAGMSPEEREQMRKSMEQMRAQMDQMSDQQRQMMEKMMGGKLEKMEKMLAQGSMGATVRVKEIRVNEGPPEQGGG